MNLQTYGREMDLVNGMFSVNGNCGYVLKPQLLRNGVDPRTCVDYQPKLMHVTIICAQYLPKTENEDSDIVDPYVLVEVHGIEADEAKHRTKTVWNNGEFLKFVTLTKEHQPVQKHDIFRLQPGLERKIRISHALSSNGNFAFCCNGFRYNINGRFYWRVFDPGG